MRHLLAIDQSTSGTKALLLDEAANIIGRADKPHRQIVSEEGWVSHDPIEIYENVLAAVRQVVEETGVPKASIAGVGISNQRETALAWDSLTGLPAGNAVVWQCVRAQPICDRLAVHGDSIRHRTGIPLSPYYSAAKLAWLLEQTELPMEQLRVGTVDSWLVYKLTGGKVFATDYSNASRTQLLNLETLAWDPEICAWFGIPEAALAEIRDSDGDYGVTDFEGFLDSAIPIRAVLGDSHGALFGQGCLEKGMAKATYGTGSSVMMNIGGELVRSQRGLVTSLAWGMGGKVDYVLEGNINYTGSVIQWACELGLLSSPKEAGQVAKEANPNDATYLIPAFTGLGAPHWNSEARGMFCGMSRSTGRAELVKAAEECIAYQIRDVADAMQADAGIPLRELRVDGGPTRDAYLMQFQSDMLGLLVAVPEREELSALGAAYAAGIALGLLDKAVLTAAQRRHYRPDIEESLRESRYGGWKAAVERAIYNGEVPRAERKSRQ